MHTNKHNNDTLENVVFTDDQRSVTIMLINHMGYGGPFANNENLAYFTRYAATNALTKRMDRLTEEGQTIARSALAAIKAAP